MSVARLALMMVTLQMPEPYRVIRSAGHSQFIGSRLKMKQRIRASESDSKREAVPRGSQ